MIFKYPYSDMYTLNLDWMVNAIKEVQDVIGELGEVVNSVNEMTGEVVLTKQFVLDLLGSAVEKFNGRSGEVTLTAADVNATAIDITYVSDPGETISDFTSADFAEMYGSGKRLMILLNNLGVPDQLYCLVPVGNAIEAQAYTPTSAEAGVVSVNGASGALILTGDNLPFETGEEATINDAVTNLGNNLATESSTRVSADSAIMDNLRAGVCPVITSATVNNSGVDIAAGDYFVARINNVPTLVQANAAILQDASYTSNYDAVTGNGGLNALNAKIPTDSSVTVINYSANSTVIYKKTNGMVSVRVNYNAYADGSIEAWTTKTLYTFPSGYRPPFEVTVRACADRSSGSSYAMGVITSSGEVQVAARNEKIDGSISGVAISFYTTFGAV